MSSTKSTQYAPAMPIRKTPDTINHQQAKNGGKPGFQTRHKALTNKPGGHGK